MKKMMRYFTPIALLSLFSWGAAAADPPVSYYREIVPIFKKSCTGCHHPGKLKGELDLTTFAAFAKGGKHGVAFKQGDSKGSEILEQIGGSEPSMPKEGDPLSKEEVSLIARWIDQGAKDDTPPEALNPFKLDKPPEYTALPVVSSIAYAPDSSVLAVSGYHEVLLHKTDGSGVAARLVGESPRIESIVFSPDGRWLGVAGGAPSRFGEIQIWDWRTHQQKKAFKVSTDSAYGLSWSPDGTRIAVGCADKSVRILSAEDGKELMKFDNHSDWVFATTFTADGKRLLSGSRDRAMKLIDAANGQFIDDINKLLEGVLCMAHHPKEDVVVCGGDLGTPRIYKISDNQNRGVGDTARDANLVKELERQPGAVRAICYNNDGTMIAASGAPGEVRVYKNDGTKVSTLKGMEGYTFTLAFHPAKNQIAAAGFDGFIRIFDAGSGTLITNFASVPLKHSPVVAAVHPDPVRK